MHPKLLLVDDEETLRESLAEVLRGEDWEVITRGDGQSALDLLKSDNIDVLITDVRMPKLDGRELLLRCREVTPQTLVMIMTAFGSVDSAVEMMNLGARDYVMKPISFDDMIVKIKRLLEFHTLTEQYQQLRNEVERRWSFQDIIGISSVINDVLEVVKKLAETKSNVLIVGESGTGKELIARAIHFNGVTKTGRFVAVNCGGIADTLIEAEFFGYRKGAFTGAVAGREGYFKAADGGTLFLDEISNLSASGQATILRAIEERAAIPVGDTKSIPIDLRVIAATNRNLADMMTTGEFREDLYYRLNVVEITLPPLRERPGDIPQLVEHFRNKYKAELNKRCPAITEQALHMLQTHLWKGNIRELENVIERAIIFAGDDPIDVEHLPFADHEQRYAGQSKELRTALAEFERLHILSVLRESGYDKHEAAQTLGIGLSSLYRKMDELDVPRTRDSNEIPAASGRG